MMADVPRHDARVVKLHYKGEGEIKKILYFVGKVTSASVYSLRGFGSCFADKYTVKGSIQSHTSFNSYNRTHMVISKVHSIINIFCDKGFDDCSICLS